MLLRVGEGEGLQGLQGRGDRVVLHLYADEDLNELPPHTRASARLFQVFLAWHVGGQSDESVAAEQRGENLTWKTTDNRNSDKTPPRT